MIGWTRAILFERLMCSSMRWNSATSGSMASPRQRPCRPGYHPSSMLKLYIFGYLNRFNRAGGWSVRLAAIWK